MQVLITWAGTVVPPCMSLRDPDLSQEDRRLESVSKETVGLVLSDPLAVGVSEPLGLFGATGPTNIGAHVTTPSGSPSCRLQTATCSPVKSDEVAGRGADPAPGAGLLLAA